MPDLAADLCWRQHRIFASAGRLAGDIAVMSLMPLVNISRLLTRDGDGAAAYDVLTRLYRAAQKREAAVIHGRTVDLAALVRTDADHRKVCEELWITVLVDGARALARIGRWTEAADAMTKHRGIANRLLDGRQIKIMSLMERGLGQEALDLIDSTVPTEPWENTVAALLRAHCQPTSSPLQQQDLDVVLQQATALVSEPDPSTALFQTRVGLSALELDPASIIPAATLLRSAVADAARRDAYAAREVLDSHATRTRLSSEHKQSLNAVITSSGLAAGTLPRAHLQSLTDAATLAEATLSDLLAPGRSTNREVGTAGQAAQATPSR
nr:MULTISPECIES: hypothetical protein [unclassified Streptomyces]